MERDKVGGVTTVASLSRAEMMAMMFRDSCSRSYSVLQGLKSNHWETYAMYVSKERSRTDITLRRSARKMCIKELVHQKIDAMSK